MTPEPSSSARTPGEQSAEPGLDSAAGATGNAQASHERASAQRRTSTKSGPADHAPGRRLWLNVAVIAAIIGFAALLFKLLDTAGNHPPAAAPTAETPTAHPLKREQIETISMRLGAAVQENPKDGRAWLMQARSLVVLGRFREASTAFARAASLLPPDGQLLADYAEALALAQDRHMTGEAEQLLKRALAADPRNLKALALSGSAAFERQDYPGAIDAWRKVLGIVPADSKIADRVRAGIAEAEVRSGKGSGR